MEGFDVVKLFTAGGAASMLAKLAVDGIKVAVDLNRWVPVLLAFVFCAIFEWLLLVAQGTSFTNQVYAQAALTVFAAWGLSIGVTALQTKANKTDEKIDLALQAKPGTSRAEIDQQAKTIK